MTLTPLQTLSPVWDLPGTTSLHFTASKMFSIFSKSVKSIPVSDNYHHHQHHLHRPSGILSGRIFLLSKLIDVDPVDVTTININVDNSSTIMEVRSNINFQTSSNTHKHYNKYRDKRRAVKSKNFRGLFGSDCEDEITSVVSDNPQLYHRSASMVSLGIHNMKVIFFGMKVGMNLSFNFLNLFDADHSLRQI